MHYFEEEYQRRFKDAESTNGIDPDQLWADIAGDLEPEQKPARRKMLWLWLLPFLLLGVGLTIYLTKDTRELPATQASQKPLETLVVEAVPQEVAAPDKGPAKSNIAVEQTQTMNPQNTSSAIALTHLSETPFFGEGQDRTPTTLTHNTPAEPISEQTKTPSTSNLDKIEAPATAIPTSENSTVINPLPTLALLPVREADQPDLPAVAVLQSTTAPSAAGMKWGVKATALSWQDRFQGQNDTESLAADLAESHRSQGGYGLGVQLDKAIGANWSITLGLEFQQLYNQFDWTRTWDTVMYRTDMPGSDLIAAVGTRRVKHQNELQSLHMPLLIAYEAGGLKWRWGLQTGLGLNYLLAQKGKTLSDESTVQAFENSDQGPYRKFYLSAQLQPYLAYSVTRQIDVRLQAKLGYQWHGRSEVYNLRHTSLLLGGGVGVFYAW